MQYLGCNIGREILRHLRQNERHKCSCLSIFYILFDLFMIKEKSDKSCMITGIFCMTSNPCYNKLLFFQSIKLYQITISFKKIIRFLLLFESFFLIQKSTHFKCVTQFLHVIEKICIQKPNTRLIFVTKKRID